jgi:hypothetical protein
LSIAKITYLFRRASGKIFFYVVFPLIDERGSCGFGNIAEAVELTPSHFFF